MGCRIEYISGLSSELTEYIHKYSEMYERDPFAVKHPIIAGIAGSNGDINKIKLDKSSRN